jgi:chemotaxis protein MotB
MNVRSRATHSALDQEESYFISMTDIMVGLLFIFLILLTYFAFQLQDEAERQKDETVPLSEYQILEAERDALLILIENLESQAEILEGERDGLIIFVFDLEAQIEVLEKESGDLAAEINQLRIEVEEKDLEIAAFLIIIKDLKAEKSELEKEVDRLNALIRELRLVDELTLYLEVVEQRRIEILERLRQRLIDAGVGVVVIQDQGIIRLPEGVLFGVGEHEIQPDSNADRNIGILADALNVVIPCFSFVELEPPDISECDKSQDADQAFVEALLIEGHTDNTPIEVGGLGDAPEITDNLRLSARRASNTYAALLQRQPRLSRLWNPAQQQVLAAAAFGETRPIEPNDGPENRAWNRRIDVRILMFTPITASALEELRVLIRARYDN